MNFGLYAHGVSGNALTTRERPDPTHRPRPVLAALGLNADARAPRLEGCGEDRGLATSPCNKPRPPAVSPKERAATGGMKWYVFMRVPVTDPQQCHQRNVMPQNPRVDPIPGRLF